MGIGRMDHVEISWLINSPHCTESEGYAWCVVFVCSSPVWEESKSSFWRVGVAHNTASPEPEPDPFQIVAIRASYRPPPLTRRSGSTECKKAAPSDAAALIEPLLGAQNVRPVTIQPQLCCFSVCWPSSCSPSLVISGFLFLPLHRRRSLSTLSLVQP